MRIPSLLELVAAIAIGFGVAIWLLRDPYSELRFDGPLSWETLHLAFDGFLAGCSLAGLAGVCLERLRGRTPRSWGFGRWVPCLVTLYLVLIYLCDLPEELANAARGELEKDIIDYWITERPRTFVRVHLRDFLPYTLIASAATMALLTRRVDRVRADGREWAGRILATLIVADGIATVVKACL